MNSAVLFVRNQKEQELAKTKLLGKPLIDYTVAELKRLDVETIYLISNNDLKVENVIKRDEISEIIEELKNQEGKCILTSPFYPLIDKIEYQKLLENENNAVFVDEQGDLIQVFAIDNTLLASFEQISYSGVEIKKEKNLKFSDLNQIGKFNEIIKEKVNNKWINKGVVITDPKNTYIGIDANIDKDTTIYPNVTIFGKCLIGKNNIITSGSILEGSVVGDDNIINSSHISNSIIHNNVEVGTNCCLENNCEIYDNVKIGSLVKLINTKVEKNTKIEHLSFLCDASVGEKVKIGAGVVTVNNDERSKLLTTIKSNSVIESNASLIAPITIGEYAAVAAGSTIDQDVKDGDLAIARLYQQNKKGFGYKYKED